MSTEIKFNDDREFADLGTGEYLPVAAGSKLIPPERVNQMAQYAQRNNQTFDEKNENYKDTLEARGHFFSVLVRKTETLWGNLSEPTVGKLIFLATYMDKNNCICFDGGWEKTREGKKQVIVRKAKPMAKTDIRELLGVSNHTFYQFWNECVSKVRMIKVFKHAVRYMYENTDERSKKSLTHLYRLIPFINLKYNILCENPFEVEREKLVPLTAADICEKLGLDRKFHERVVKALKKLSFVDKQGNIRSVITYRWDRKNEEERYWITINPQFYSGYIGETEMMQMLDDFRYNENELEMYDL